MKGERLRRALEELRLPAEEQVQARSWQVVRAAFVEREPLSRRRSLLRPVLVVAVLAVLGAALASPAGRAVLNSVREAVGVERAKPALFSLPAPGRLLVTSPAGSWVVTDDGSTRLLGTFDEASWSPFGHFVVVARANELAALEPNGTLRWKLARPNVHLPSWGGTLTDTGIAYLSGRRLHVVAGDGTGDLDAGGSPAAAPVAPAWQPGSRDLLAYATTGGRIYAYEPETGALHWRSAPFPHPRKLLWSADGKRLLLVTRDKLVLFAADRPQPLATRLAPDVVDAAFAPASNQIALLRPRELLLLNGDRLSARPERVFAGAGRFDTVDWSPDGRWLLIAWPDADQWLFVAAAGRHRLEAVSNISSQFEGGFPTVNGWCCANGP